jgi:hydrogenase 3 maturation protease
LPLSWKKQTSRYLQKLRSNSSQFRVVLVGVGNQFMGDDAAGMLVVQKLKASLPAVSRLIPMEGGPAPENCSGSIRKLKPDLVVFIDAGEIGRDPGSIELFESNAAEGVSAFGHALPLSVLGLYLESELACPCLLLIIQPERVDFDQPVTDRVQQAVEVIVNYWTEFSDKMCG